MTELSKPTTRMIMFSRKTVTLLSFVVLLGFVVMGLLAGDTARADQRKILEGPGIKPVITVKPFVTGALTCSYVLDLTVGARNKSITAWSWKVRNIYGEEYSHWSRAKEKSLRCMKNREGQHCCSARAKPSL